MNSINYENHQKIIQRLENEHKDYWYEHIPERLKDNKDFMLAAVQQDGRVLYDASKGLQANRDIVLAAVQQNGHALYYASDKLKADRDVVLAAVGKYGEALRLASNELKADRDIIIAAIQQKGRALKFASDSIFMTLGDDNNLTALIQNFLKNEPEGRKILHQWVLDPRRKDTLHALVDLDPSIAYVKDTNGVYALDKAESACKIAMKSALRLFGEFQVDDDTPLLHTSRTTCVFKAFCDREEYEQVRNDSEKKEQSNVMPVALKCMHDHHQVMAELISRKNLNARMDNDNIIKLIEVYIDASIESQKVKEFENIANCFEDTIENTVTIHLVENLKRKVREHISKNIFNIQNKNKKDVNRYQFNTDRFGNYSYVLVFEYGTRNLNSILTHDHIVPGSFLAKTLLEDIATSILSLHRTNRIHGDIKPLNIVTVDSKIKLIDLDISCGIGKNYGGKVPSSGYSPPEVAKLIFNSKNKSKNSLQTLKASIAHDLFSFGAIMYRIESGRPLLKTDQNDNVIEDDKKLLKKWSKRILAKKLQYCNEEAKGILRKLLDPNPKSRLQFFQCIGLDVMEKVLKDPYFNIHKNFSYTNQTSPYTTIEPNHFRLDLIDELNFTKGIFLHTKCETDEDQFPTTFVLLKEQLPDKRPTQEELMKIDMNKDLSDFKAENDVPNAIASIKANMDRAKELLSKLSERNTAESMTLSLEHLFTEKMYFYLIDELTGEPIEGEGYPILINKCAEDVKSILPLIQCSMSAMSLFNGVSGICKMFGYPITSIPESIEHIFSESVNILKQRSSVEKFEQSKPDQMSLLRDLKQFLQINDSKSTFAGLRRITDKKGGALWTAVPDEDMEEYIEEREKQWVNEDKKSVQYEKKILQEKREINLKEQENFEREKEEFAMKAKEREALETQKIKRQKELVDAMMYEMELFQREKKELQIEKKNFRLEMALQRKRELQKKKVRNSVNKSVKNFKSMFCSKSQRRRSSEVEGI